MSELKVVVKGLGAIAVHEHLPALVKMPGIKVAAVVSGSAERAREVAEKFKISAYYSDLREAFEKEKPDAVVICSPTFKHKEDALIAAEYDVHIFLEKPIALRIKDSQDIINAARKKGLKLMVGHVLRFWPEYVSARQAILAGEIGEPRIARAYRRLFYPTWSYGMWHKWIEKSGGVFVDLSIHDVDYLRWVLGEVKEVFARGGIFTFKDATAYDYMHALLKFESGAIAFVEGCWILPETHPFYTYLEIAGTNGLMVVDRFVSAGLKLFTKKEVLYDTPLPKTPYYLELEAFFKSIREDTEPPVPGEEALKSLEVTLAAVKSAKEGKPVKLPLTEEVIP